MNQMNYRLEAGIGNLNFIATFKENFHFTCLNGGCAALISYLQMAEFYLNCVFFGVNGGGK